MDPQVSTSFIPKKPLIESRRRSATGLIFLIALLVFIGSVAAAGGAFLYNTYLARALEAKMQSLETAQGAFESAGAIENLIRLDGRINEAKNLLGEHIAPSALFFFLSAQTLERVRFTQLEFQLREDGSAEINLQGETDDFQTIALQSDQFGASQILRNIVFSDISVQLEGGVTFALSATIERDHLLYSKNLTQAPLMTLPEDSSAPTDTATSTPAASGTSTTPTP